MSAITIKALKAFIKAQPKDRPVNHNSWETCSVGDFAQSIAAPRSGVTQILNKACGYDQEWFAQSDKYERSVMGILNRLHGESTYGELQKELKL